MTGRASFPVFGTTAHLLVTDPDALPRALRLLRTELAAIDAACSRFRPDSELSRANTAAAEGRAVTVGPRLAEALDAALQASARTGGLVDPTVGTAVINLGYDRTFASLRPEQLGLPPAPAAAPIRPDAPRPPSGPTAARAQQAGGPASQASQPGHWSEPGGGPGTGTVWSPSGPTAARAQYLPGVGARALEWDPTERRLRVPAGVALDLGATAKAWAADRSARLLSAALGCGVLVNLGGDLAVVGGSPDGGWRIAVADDHRAPAPDAPVVAVTGGGLATSGTTVRTWWRDGHPVHHVVDPRTGRNPEACWRTVTVAAATCLAANTAATAALVLGPDAPAMLRHAGLPARLVHDDGGVLRVCGWPEDTPTHDAPTHDAPTHATPRGAA
ncbi:thiamine biosynthesis lipoprotein [Streptacidiphilus sp. MAP12-33]|uniref:FAD:protein FMN transferase n=1 Tax=Streptacidiphilus sp. MAP12-33 TaxID=3156266 RepID=UPI003513264D